MEDTELALALVERARVLAWDTETTGLGLDDKVVGWAFADEDVEVYIPVRHRTGNRFKDPRDWEQALARSFARRSRNNLLTVGFNLGFDLFMASKHGVYPWAPLEDAQINEVLLNETQRAYGLAACLKRRELPGKEDHELIEYLQAMHGGPRTRKAQMGKFWTLDGSARLAQLYAKGDARGTYDLWAAQQEELRAPDEWGFTLEKVWRLECDLIPYLAAMRQKGIRVDLDYAAEARDKISAQMERLLVDFPPGFEVTKTAAIHDWMTAQGCPSQWRTAEGKPSYTERILLGTEPGQKVLALRRLRRTIGAFINPILSTHSRRGRIHPELKQMSDGDYGVKFGRFSCIGPNLQAFPKRNPEIGKIVRPIIMPDEDMQIYEADFSQQEPRLYTHYSECRRLLEGYNSDPPVDVHTIASQCLHIKRDPAKTLGLSIFNGMTPPTLAVRLGVPEAEARRMYDAFYTAFPEIKRFRLDCTAVARDRGYVRTILGRRQHFPEGFMAHAAVSRVIQGSAADHMKVRMLDCFRWVEACGAGQIDILMSIHDALIWQSCGGMGTIELQELLEDNGAPLDLKVPMPVEIHWGRHWGEASWPGAYDEDEDSTLDEELRDVKEAA